MEKSKDHRRSFLKKAGLMAVLGFFVPKTWAFSVPATLTAKKELPLGVKKEPRSVVFRP